MQMYRFKVGQQGYQNHTAAVKKAVQNTNFARLGNKNSRIILVFLPEIEVKIYYRDNKYWYYNQRIEMSSQENYEKLITLMANKQISAEKRKKTIEEKKNKLKSDNQNTVSTHNHDQMLKISFEDRVKAAVNRIKADQAQTKANEMLKMSIQPFKNDSITTDIEIDPNNQTRLQNLKKVRKLRKGTKKVACRIKRKSKNRQRTAFPEDRTRL